MKTSSTVTRTDPMPYTMNKCETVEDWLSLLCQDLNKETKGMTLRYRIQRVFNAPKACYLSVSKGRRSYPIEVSVGYPRYRGHNGRVIAAVRVKAEVLQTRQMMHLPSKFSVTHEGKVDAKEVNALVQTVLAHTTKTKTQTKRTM